MNTQSLLKAQTPLTMHSHSHALQLYPSAQILASELTLAALADACREMLRARLSLRGTKVKRCECSGSQGKRMGKKCRARSQSQGARLNV